MSQSAKKMQAAFAQVNTASLDRNASYTSQMLSFENALARAYAAGVEAAGEPATKYHETIMRQAAQPDPLHLPASEMQ